MDAFLAGNDENASQIVAGKLSNND